jgi:RimJ/RimL family protein N-acetyltransferase
MHHPYIIGKKLYLRGIEKEDLSGNMIQWPNDPEVTYYMVMGAIPNGGPIYCSWDSAEEEYEILKKSNKDILFAIVDKKSDEMIGLVGLYDISWIPRHAELRIVIGEKDFWNKGYGTEATKLVIKYGFEKLNLNKVYLGVNAEDRRAVKAYQKAGFLKEGKLRQHVYRNSKYYDIIKMSVLKEEYK